MKIILIMVPIMIIGMNIIGYFFEDSYNSFAEIPPPSIKNHIIFTICCILGFWLLSFLIFYLQGI